MCKFAKDNVMFENMFANANHTLPSHTSIFTGLYPSQHGVNMPNVDSLSRSVPFLPEILQQNGYKTYMYMGLKDINLPVDKVFYRGIDELVDIKEPLIWEDGINTLRKNNQQGKKSFLFLHTYWVHGPYILNNQNEKLFAKDGIDVNIPQTRDEVTACSPKFISYLKRAMESDLRINYWVGKRDVEFRSMISDLKQRKDDDASICKVQKYEYFLQYYFGGYYSYQLQTLNTDQIKHVVNLYDSKIKELDEFMQKIFDDILKTDLKKNTIIIVTSDHGEEFLEHGMLEHGNNLYDTVLKIPLFIYIPGQGGKKISQLTQSVDIMPTLLNLVGVKQNTISSGINLFDYHTDRNLYAEYALGKLKTVRNNQWKLIMSTNEVRSIAYELYDIQTDPQEKNNLVFKRRDVVLDMLR